MDDFTSDDWWNCARRLNEILPKRCQVIGAVWDANLAEKLYRARRRNALRDLYQGIYDSFRYAPGSMAEETSYMLFEVIFDAWHDPKRRYGR